MEELSPTGRVICAMLSIGRRTGYDIKALVDKATRFFWATSYGQLYPELKRLEADGLIRASEPEGGRRRTEYELTESGEAALQEWLTSSDELVYEVRDEGLLKFFFGESMRPADLIDQLEKKARQHDDVAAYLRGIEQTIAPAEGEPPAYPYLTARGGVEFHEFLAGWCRRMQDVIRETRGVN